jgi:hypothetical protein
MLSTRIGRVNGYFYGPYRGRARLCSCLFRRTAIALIAHRQARHKAFSRSWPDAPHRVLRSCVTAAEAFQGDTVGEMTALDGTRMPALRLATFGVDKTATGTIAAMSLFAGKSVGAVTQVQSAAEILRNLVDECVRERQ